MKTSRKAIVLLMTGAMLLAATTGAFAQGYGRMGGSRIMTPGYGYHSMGPTSPGTGSLGYGPRGGFNGSSNPGFFGGMRMMGSSGYGALHYFQYQKLSTEDKAKVDKIVQDSSAQVLPLQNEIRAARLELDNLLWSASPDKSKIDEFVAKIANLQKQIQEVRATTIIEINAIFQATK
jgi:Spy/CpxP family protein refolding chaperone